MYLEGLRQEKPQLGDGEGEVDMPQQQPQPSGGRTHKIETLVPVQQIPGVANWVSDGFMDGVKLPVGTVS